MCGIFGVINGTNAYQKRLLALLNETRGKDSVGIYADGARYRVPEKISDAVIGHKIPQKAWDARVFLGHTRAGSPGTKGGSKETCHPFRYKNIMCAHNGYIRNHFSLKNEFKQDFPAVEKFCVDSQMIAFVLAEFGIEGLKRLEGYASAWWIDSKVPNYVWLWASNQDLCVVKTKSGPIAFSSNMDHLKLCDFNGGRKLDGKGAIYIIDTEKLDFFQVDTPAIEINNVTVANNFNRTQDGHYVGEFGFGFNNRGVRVGCGETWEDVDEEALEDYYRNGRQVQSEAVVHKPRIVNAQCSEEENDGIVTEKEINDLVDSDDTYNAIHAAAILIGQDADIVGMNPQFLNIDRVTLTAIIRRLRLKLEVECCDTCKKFLIGWNDVARGVDGKRRCKRCNYPVSIYRKTDANNSLLLARLVRIVQWYRENIMSLHLEDLTTDGERAK